VNARWAGEIVGHRGAAGLAPENTLPSFEAAIAAGCDRVELDVRLAAADLPVVFHDHSLDRLGPELPAGERARPLSSLTAEEVALLDVGARLGRPGCFVPTFDGFLDAIGGRVALNVEIKGGGDFGLRTCELAVAALRARALAPTTVLSSFHPRVVEGAREGALDRARALGCEGLHPHRVLVDTSLVTACRAAGLRLRAWTANEEDDIRRLMELGVDGIVSDRPDLVRVLAGR